MAAARGDPADLLGNTDNEIRVMQLMEIFPNLSWRQLHRHCDLFPVDVEFGFLVDSLIDIAPDGGTPPQDEDDGIDVSVAAEVSQNLPKDTAESPTELLRSSSEDIPGSPAEPEWGTPPQELVFDVSAAAKQLQQNLPADIMSSSSSPELRSWAGTVRSGVDAGAGAVRYLRKLPAPRPRVLTRKRIVKAHRRCPAPRYNFELPSSESEFEFSEGESKDSEEKPGTVKKDPEDPTEFEHREEQLNDSSQDSTEESANSEEDLENSVLEVPVQRAPSPEIAEVSDSSASPSPRPAPVPAAEVPSHLRLAELFPDVPIEALTTLCEEHHGLALEQLVAECLLQQEAKEAAELADNDFNDLDVSGALDVANGNDLQPSDDEVVDDDAVAGILAEENIPDEPEDLGMIERYQTLLTLFPSADPDFLRERAASLTAETVPDFVARTLETGTYPKEEEYRARERIRRLKAKYVDRFDAAAFLATIPDPIEHFESRKAAVSADRTMKALAYLNLRYTGQAPEDLAARLQRLGGNLSLVCAEVGVGQSTKDLLDDFTNDEALLQEIAFIEHREELVLLRRRMVESKQVAVIAAQSKKETLTCGCCCGDTFLLADMAACIDGHLFCKDCIVRSAEILIGQGKFEVPCLEDCGKEFSVKTLKAVLKRSVFLRLEQRRQFEEVHAAEIPDLETCPACDFSAIPRPDDIVFTCLNPDCLLVSCRKCREPNHIPLHCDELPEKEEHLRIRTQLEDRMTQALVRECWQCKKKFVKSDGCNKMRCTCGALMCYLCRQPVRDYSHFNGQGGDAYEKCELFSNNEKLHIDAVRNEAVKARAEVAAANPNLDLKYDPTLLLP